LRLRGRQYNFGKKKGGGFIFERGKDDPFHPGRKEWYKKSNTRKKKEEDHPLEKEVLNSFRSGAQRGEKKGGCHLRGVYHGKAGKRWLQRRGKTKIRPSSCKKKIF